jgi:hypothetical protein
MLAAAAATLLAAGLWHLPAASLRAAEPTAQPAPAPAAPARMVVTQSPASEPITFDAYREFRLRYVAQRQARLARELAAPNLSPDDKARLARIKAYYDDLAAMPAAQRDKLFRARFDQIDTNRDGKLDNAERAAWRAKQRAYYSQLAADRAAPKGDPQ